MDIFSGAWQHGEDYWDSADRAFYEGYEGGYNKRIYKYVKVDDLEVIDVRPKSIKVKYEGSIFFLPISVTDRRDDGWYIWDHIWNQKLKEISFNKPNKSGLKRK